MIFEYFLIYKEPNPDDPLNQVAGKQMIDDMYKFK